MSGLIAYFMNQAHSSEMSSILVSRVSHTDINNQKLNQSTHREEVGRHERNENKVTLIRALSSKYT